ncbi:MAG: hypothetical protein OCU12_06120 [Methanophagales archaeon]|nr:hypothetical protein [Methanophagales archaeon]
MKIPKKTIACIFDCLCGHSQCWGHNPVLIRPAEEGVVEFVFNTADAQVFVRANAEGEIPSVLLDLPRTVDVLKPHAQYTTVQVSRDGFSVGLQVGPDKYSVRTDVVFSDSDEEPISPIVFDPWVSLSWPREDLDNVLHAAASFAAPPFPDICVARDGLFATDKIQALIYTGGLPSQALMPIHGDAARMATGLTITSVSWNDKYCCIEGRLDREYPTRIIAPRRTICTERTFEDLLFIKKSQSYHKSFSFYAQLDQFVHLVHLLMAATGAYNDGIDLEVHQGNVFLKSDYTDPIPLRAYRVAGDVSIRLDPVRIQNFRSLPAPNRGLVEFYGTDNVSPLCIRSGPYTILLMPRHPRRKEAADENPYQGA